MKNELRICLSIYHNHHFYSESEIVNNLPEIRGLVESRGIKLLVTDGAISITYHNEELLGKKYWDDVHFILNDVFYSLEDLENGKEIEGILPMQSTLLKLKLSDDMVIYKLQFSEQRISRTGESHIVRRMPKHLFMREFIHFYLRSARIFATIGANAKTFADFSIDDDIEDELIGHPFQQIIDNWREYIPKGILSSTEINELQTFMDMPLPEWIAIIGC